VTPPAAFRTFCQRLFQDVHFITKGEIDMIEFAAEHHSQDDRAVVREFIATLEQKDLPIEDLQDMWFKSGSDIFFEGEDLRKFLHLVRENI